MEEGQLPREHGEINKDRASKYECNKCHIKLFYTEFVFHRRNVHPQSKFVCTVCDFKTNKKNGKYGIESHKKFHTKQKYGCKRCEFRSSTMDVIGKHLLQVHNKMPFECTECDFTYNKEEMLKKHILNVHEGIFYMCDKCDLKFIKETSLIHHSNVIHKGLQFNCVSCDFTTKSKNALAYHIRTIHQGIWHSCNICESKFKTSGDLVEHMQSKHEGKKFVCNICSFWFVTYKKMKKHYVDKHEAKYKCKECCYKTNGKLSLTRHKMNEHTKQDLAISDVPETESNKGNSIQPQSQSKKRKREGIQKNKDLKDKLLADPSRWKQFVPTNYICRWRAVRDLRINTKILDKFEHLAIFAPSGGAGPSGIFYPKEVLRGHEGPELLPMGLVPESWIFRSLLKCEREASNFPLAIRPEGVFGQQAGRKGKSIYWYQVEVLERWWPKLVERWRDFFKITQNCTET